MKDILFQLLCVNIFNYEIDIFFTPRLVIFFVFEFYLKPLEFAHLHLLQQNHPKYSLWLGW